jgi:hypothetical protein
MITCEEVIDRVRDAVDGIEVDAGPDDTYLAILRAGMTLAGIALCHFDEAERERLLQDLESSTRDYLARLEAAKEARQRRSPYPRVNGQAH